MYWAEKLAVGFLRPYFGAIDEHSGLSVEMQLEVLRRVRFVGPDAAPQPLWSVHRNLDVLQRMINVTTQSSYFRGRAAQVWIGIMVQIACAQMTTDGAILPEPRLLRLVGTRQRRPARRHRRAVDGALRGAQCASRQRPYAS